MINIRSINKLTENGSLTLKNGAPITYPEGYQVGIDGVECATAREAINAIKARGGNCGVWFSKGIYYIDNSKHYATKRRALTIARTYKQATIFRWSDKSVIKVGGIN